MVLEKASEIGITEISPLICDRSERKFINEKRLKKGSCFSNETILEDSPPSIKSID